MKITITPTNLITSINGQMCRAWDGTTEDGIRCRLFVHRLVVHNEADRSAFDREIISMPHPTEVSTAVAIDFTQPEVKGYA